MRQVILIIVLCCVCSFLAPARAASGKADLELRIAQSLASPRKACYVSAAHIPVLLEVINRTASPQEVLLKDHGQDGYQEPVLVGMQVRLYDASGRCLTAGDSSADGWWSWEQLKSTICLGKKCEMPGDRVRLTPGQSVRRAFELTWLLGGAAAVPRELAPGLYAVQVRLGPLESNLFDFRIAADGKCNDADGP